MAINQARGSHAHDLAMDAAIWPPYSPALQELLFQATEACDQAPGDVALQAGGRSEFAKGSVRRRNAGRDLPLSARTSTRTPSWTRACAP
jgi:hypothetical protein